MADTLQPCYVIEAALLTSPQPLTLEDLSRLFAGRLTQTELLEAMNMLSEHWKERGLRLVETASGWGFVTSTAVGEYLLRMSDQKMPKYSRAVMETLAIIDRAYLLYEGTILQSGTPEQLAADDDVRTKYLGSNFVLKRSVAFGKPEDRQK